MYLYVNNGSRAILQLSYLHRKLHFISFSKDSGRRVRLKVLDINAIICKVIYQNAFCKRPVGIDNPLLIENIN